jgi:CheY-like chemotaxis protein
MHPQPSKSPIQKWTGRTVDVHQPQLRVLVVDDNANAADALAAYLSSDRIDCRVAYGGAEAIVDAVTNKPHVILMDISMPKCNGYQASLTIRHDARTSHIAILAHTALDEAEVRRNLSDSEFDGYCQKGQSPEKLIALMSTFLT